MAQNETQGGKGRDTYFVITYREQQEGKLVTLKARAVTDSSLGLSFIAISDFVFSTNGLVVNPTEEDLKKRFENVKTLHLSIYTIISIEEVGAEHDGLSFKKDKSNLVVLSPEQHQPRDK
ncbi:MAG: DUF1820 family protein [Desulfobacteraceae bacterium]|nr:DUF1820 family protein [Desulfobacteraceae bacterium]